MIDIQSKEPEHSEEYINLLQELKNSFVSAANMAVKLYEQGKKDGLSNEEIRKDIETALDTVEDVDLAAIIEDVREMLAKETKK